MASRVVLVVDPDPATARKVRGALQGVALDVRSASTFADGRDAASEPGLAVALCALSLPGGSGYELARVLR